MKTASIEAPRGASPRASRLGARVSFPISSLVPLFLSTFLFGFACWPGPARSSSSATAEILPPHEKAIELRVSCYQGMIVPSLARRFEAEMSNRYGRPVAVTQVPILSDGEAFFSVRSGRVDVTCPTHNVLKSPSYPYISARLLAGLDLARLSHFAELLPRMRHVASVEEDGNVYAVPFIIAPYMLVYDPAKVHKRIESWNELFDESHAGRLVLSGSYFEANMIAVALSLGKTGKDLFDYDLLTRDPRFAARIRALTRRSLRMYKGVDQPKDYEGADVGLSFGGALAAGPLGPSHWRIAQTREGAPTFLGTWAISRTVTDHPLKEKLAYEWIDFTLGAEYQKKLAEVGALPANAALHEHAQRSGAPYEGLKGLKDFLVVDVVAQRRMNGFRILWEDALRGAAE